MWYTRCTQAKQSHSTQEKINATIVQSQVQMELTVEWTKIRHRLRIEYDSQQSPIQHTMIMEGTFADIGQINRHVVGFGCLQ